MDEPLVVRRAERSELHAAAALLARAFADDPITAFVQQAHPRSRDWMVPTYTVYVRAGFLFGEVHVAEDLHGVAVWLAPGQAPLSAWRLVRAGAVRWALTCGWSIARGSLAFSTATEQLHRQCASGAHWYLAFMGVEPGRQRAGIGHGLLQPMLRRADAERLPCYLESPRRSMSLYQRNGFRVVAERAIQPDGPRLWGMVRDPAGSGGA